LIEFKLYFLPEEGAREQVIEGVVSVFDTGEHGGIPYLVMEEVKGDDIRQLRKQKTFDPREVVRIYEKVVRTIKGYSGGSITHCDIKEGNVMLCDSTGEAVIVDWGERRSQPQYATDTQAAAAIAFALLVDYKDRTGKSIPGNLEKILEEARSDESMTPDKALNDIQHYHQIPRRRWKKAALKKEVAEFRKIAAEIEGVDASAVFRGWEVKNIEEMGK
jgi:serine/threonine protein kinase